MKRFSSFLTFLALAIALFCAGKPASGGTVWGSDSNTTYSTAAPTLGGLSWKTFNSNATNDPNDQSQLWMYQYVDGTGLNPGFTSNTQISSVLVDLMGRNQYGNGTNAKITYTNLGLYAVHYGAGQRFLESKTMDCYGMGDCFTHGANNLTYSGANIGGDEGIGWQSASFVSQLRRLQKSQITSVPAQTTCNTTTTQAVKGSGSVQSVAVTDITNCKVNDWIVVNQMTQTSHQNMEAVQITSIGVGTISGIFLGNYVPGVTVTPAIVLNVGSVGGYGQDRVIVNLSGPSYSVGTAAVNGRSANFLGVGTTWADNMVGGTTMNPGCIAFDADNYTSAPFSPGAGTLKSWWQIVGVNADTSLGIYSNDTAGASNYQGKATAQGAYIIRPCARVLNVRNQSQIILESNSFAWTANDNIEQAIAPYPDVPGTEEFVAGWTNGGIYRSIHDMRNTGARKFKTAIQISGNMPAGPDVDDAAFETGISVGSSNTAILAQGNKHGLAFYTYGHENDICWAGALCINPNNGDVAWQMSTHGNGGMMYIVPGVYPGYATLAFKGKISLGTNSWQTTFDAGVKVNNRTVNVPDIDGTMLIGTAINTAATPSSFSATRSIPINIGGVTYYIPASTTPW